MSTNYYKLKDPITSIGVRKEGIHTKLTLFVNHGNAGTLTLRKEEFNNFLNLLFDRWDCVAYTHYDGIEKGIVLIEYIELHAAIQLFSESGEILTVGELRSKYDT